MGTKGYDGPERRLYFRYNLIFAPKDKAMLTIGGHVYEVLDMSVEGLRFKNKTGLPIGRQVRALLEFSSGETRTIEGEIVWEKGDEVGLILTKP